MPTNTISTLRTIALAARRNAHLNIWKTMQWKDQNIYFDVVQITQGKQRKYAQPNATKVLEQ